MIRTLIGAILRLIQIILGVTGLIFLYGVISGGGGWVPLGITVVVLLVVGNLLEWMRERITDPYNPRWYREKKPKPKKEKKLKAPKPEKPRLTKKSDPVASAPVTKSSRANKRRFATPPTVAVEDGKTAPASSAMTNELQCFVEQGQAEIDGQQP
ncbi:hypothetical protein K1718_27350 (plasmid) [Roseibium porphyridii]|uniref:Uncharacterized protein n=1 Tax=Roseibium porphyridii TaxID=2866279 RepID=A0ABY8FHF1_9HYPH|nr:hypothetical protein [Roseibium sp. KMA01]WFE92645.1 hypothetical protein K1718_27350 [Roseibium sp. KMA01]